MQLDAHPGSIDFSKVAAGLQIARSAWSDLDRYTSATRSAMVGVEVLPGIDERAAAELNDYAEQVEDVAHRLHKRSQWGAQIVQDYVNMLARHQGAQINRLTVVSVIFLPLTFMTGFFGMNFNWMINSLSSPWPSSFSVLCSPWPTSSSSSAGSGARASCSKRRSHSHRFG